MQIKEAYKTVNRRDLIKELKSEHHGHLEDGVVALFTDPIEYNADDLLAEIKGLGTNEDTLIEIIASRPPRILRQVIEKFKGKYNRDLEADVKSKTS